jgi:hypothetical protein
MTSSARRSDQNATANTRNHRTKESHDPQQCRRALVALGAVLLLVAGCMGPASPSAQPTATSAAVIAICWPGSVVAPDAAQEVRSAAARSRL